MPTIKSDSILLFHPDPWGGWGYAVANFGDNHGTNNKGIWNLVDTVGRNLFMMMHQPDTLRSSPPDINFLVDFDRLFKRIKHLMTAKVSRDNEMKLRTAHVQPAGSLFRVYPAPYFNVPNQWIRDWAEYIFIGLAEAMQHSDNSRAIEFTEMFYDDVFKWFERAYRDMAISMFGKTEEQAEAENFVLAPEDFAGYSPRNVVTSTELVDQVFDLGSIVTEDEIKELAAGIYVDALPELRPHPQNVKNYYQRRQNAAPDDTTAAATTGPLNSTSGVRDPNRRLS